MHSQTWTEISSCRYVCLSVCANVQSCAFGVTPVVSQMPSAHLEQMAADSNGPGLCEEDLSVRQVHLKCSLPRVALNVLVFNKCLCTGNIVFFFLFLCQTISKEYLEIFTPYKVSKVL